MINENGCLPDNTGRQSLSYISVGEFRGWIEGVVSGGAAVKTSLLLIILSTVLLRGKNLM